MYRLLINNPPHHGPHMKRLYTQASWLKATSLRAPRDPRAELLSTFERVQRLQRIRPSRPCPLFRAFPLHLRHGLVEPHSGLG